MMFFKVHPPFVSVGADKGDYEEVRRLLNRRGYDIISFEHETVIFYAKSALYGDGLIPIANRLTMTCKSFAAFVSILRQLDDSEMKLTDMVVKLNGLRGVG